MLAIIKWPFSFTNSLYLRGPIYQKFLKLKNNKQLVILWLISSHVSLVKHDKTNQSAKK